MIRTRRLAKLALGIIFAALLAGLLAVLVQQLQVEGEGVIAREKAEEIAKDLIQTSSTFRFDGVEGSVKVEQIRRVDPRTLDVCEENKRCTEETSPVWVVTVAYETTHPGHGDRTGQVLTQVITLHRAEIVVSQRGEVLSAVCDYGWNLTAQG